MCAAAARLKAAAAHSPRPVDVHLMLATRWHQVIIDEMSMVGRRALGQIDEMLRQATGRNDWFGGLSLILVGDHGALLGCNPTTSAVLRSHFLPCCRFLRADRIELHARRSAPASQGSSHL